MASVWRRSASCSRAAALARDSRSIVSARVRASPSMASARCLASATICSLLARASVISRSLLPLAPVSICSAWVLASLTYRSAVSVARASMREARALSSSRGWAAGGGGATAGAAGAELVVLLDQAGQLGLHDVEEGVDLVLVVAPLADGRLLEDDVVHVGRREWHLRSPQVGRRARDGSRTNGGGHRPVARSSRWPQP